MARSFIEASCEVGDWKDLPIGEQLIIQLKASNDPVFFWTHPALGNLKLWDSQKDILRDFYKFDEEGKRLLSELIFVAGRRGGKTTVAALITLFECARLLMMDDPQKKYKLTANAEIFCINVAPSESQALDTVFKRAKELIANSPFFMSYKFDVVYNAIRFPKNITLKALGSNVASGVGRTCKCFVADEVSSFQDTDKHSPDEIYFKLGNSTGNFKQWNENIRVAISSIAQQGDFITQLYKQAEDEKWPWAMWIWKKTWELNPEMSLDSLAEERKRHPEIFDRDYGAEEGVDTKSFFNEYEFTDTVERAKKVHNIFIGDPPFKRTEKKYGFTPDIDKNRLHISLYPDALDFFICTDPAIKNDAFGLTIGYTTVNNTIKIIGSTVFIATKGAEINVEDIKAVLKPILETLPIQYYIFDIYFHTELQSMVRDYNVECLQHTLDLNDWIFARNDLYDGSATVPYSDYLFKEFRELLLVKNKKIDHPSTGSKDMADSVAQLISHVRREEDEMRDLNTAVQTHYVARF